MKTPRNNETKARFFALYWGQDVMIEKRYDSVELRYLELIPLSSITDEDAIEVARIYSEKDTNTFSYYDNIQFAKFLLRTSSHLGHRFADYLRSRGYLLPYLDISTDELIELGWVKLKEI